MGPGAGPAAHLLGTFDERAQADTGCHDDGGGAPSSRTVIARSGQAVRVITQREVVEWRCTFVGERLDGDAMRWAASSTAGDGSGSGSAASTPRSL
ncbi:hypothetical protein [Nonomuraea angiospora]|uniref:hypothetical protein n=1 Tax=Nonomuraea angiospora TaxID=46172 RepID=UPI0029B7F59A|nr:hypothetical protein [Nonomuraea angiospora]MDX3108139.1 hypothetical protein [Nonomuraea angiospora]